MRVPDAFLLTGDALVERIRAATSYREIAQLRRGHDTARNVLVARHIRMEAVGEHLLEHLALHHHPSVRAALLANPNLGEAEVLTLVERMVDRVEHAVEGSMDVVAALAERFPRFAEVFNARLAARLEAKPNRNLAYHSAEGLKATGFLLSLGRPLPEDLLLKLVERYPRTRPALSAIAFHPSANPTVWYALLELGDEPASREHDGLYDVLLQTPARTDAFVRERIRTTTGRPAHWLDLLRDADPAEARLRVRHLVESAPADLLDAIGDGDVAAATLDSEAVAVLLRHLDQEIRLQAIAALGSLRPAEGRTQMAEATAQAKPSVRSR